MDDIPNHLDKILLNRAAALDADQGCLLLKVNLVDNPISVHVLRAGAWLIRANDSC